MTQQQPQIGPLRAVDVANAIMQTVVDAQTTYMYLAAVLAELGGETEVTKETLEKLREETQWEVAMETVGADRVQFKLLRGAEKINAALGRTPGGLIVP